MNPWLCGITIPDDAQLDISPVSLNPSATSSLLLRTVQISSYRYDQTALMGHTLETRKSFRSGASGTLWILFVGDSRDSYLTGVRTLRGEGCPPVSCLASGDLCSDPGNAPGIEFSRVLTRTINVMAMKINIHSFTLGSGIAEGGRTDEEREPSTSTQLAMSR